ncbi:phosphoglycerate mutase family protein [Hyphomonas oceanitis]|uniref:SixA phosphatase family protein n=1 Tax=Hyphomonas oceanitis TaxID=81033 RepID=UPI0030010F07
MRVSRRAFAGLMAAAVLSAACMSSPPPPETVIYLVRHAEKQVGDDPSLTAEGLARAEELALTLKHAGITQIYSTDTARTRQTAAPLAAALSLPVELYDASDLPAFASELTTQTGTILVVGHSNTTPPLVEQLGGDPGTEINEAGEFDRLYALHISGDTVRTDLRRYGNRYQP